MSRVNVQNTLSCIVLADAAKLLTYTLPKLDACHAGAGSPLTMVQAEMYASSPLPMVLPEASPREDILATGLTPQRDLDHNLSLCTWSERIRAKGQDTGGDVAVCRGLRDQRIAAGSGLGAFQNFAAVRPGQQIFFARAVALPPASNPLAEFLEHVDGNIYSTKGSIVVVDVVAPKAPADGPGVVTIKKISPFAVDDRFDPMMPMTRTKDDLRFLSLLAFPTHLSVYLTDFDKDNPVPREISLTTGNAQLDLHPSWAQRPALVVETSEPARKIKLVFSRGHLVISPDPLVDNPDPLIDTVRLEALVLERDASDPVDRPFSVAVAAACTVKYTLERPNPDLPCLRAFDPSRPMRPSPAAMTKASQLLVGHFTESKELGLAFTDRCLDRHPIMLVPGSDVLRDFTATVRTAEQQHVKREVDCVPLDVRERVGRAMAE